MEYYHLQLVVFYITTYISTAVGTATCDPETYMLTVGGPQVNTRCVFPFVYKSTVFNHCTNIDSDGGYWCATSNNYPRDRLWGTCPETFRQNRARVTTLNNQNCVFPFTYKGRLFFTCTSFNSLSGQKWCSSSRQYSKGFWGYCKGIPKCFDTFTRRENTQLLGGREITPISGRAQCQQLCLCNPNCTAYEWQSNKRECWHHTGQTDNTRNNNELDLYVRVRCMPIVPDCNDTYRVTQNANAPGGILELGARDVATCERSCSAGPSCVGFDLDTTVQDTPRCYLHLDAANLGQVRTGQTGISHHVRVSCFTPTQPGPGSCTDTFTRYPLTHARGGVPHSGAPSVSDCQRQCLTLDNCTAFDFARTVRPPCYLHLRSVSREYAADVDHYGRIACAKPSTSSPLRCKDSYTILRGRNAAGGTYQRGYGNIQECQTQCSTSSSCVAMDWDSGFSECYFFYDRNYQLNPGAVQGVDHYIRNSDCRSTTALVQQGTKGPGECVPRWVRFRDTLVFGGVLSPGVVTVGMCRARCEVHPSGCEGYDYDPRDMACYLHRAGTNLERVNRAAAGVDHYRKENCKKSCKETFTKTPHRNALRGVQLAPSVNTPTACQAQCVERSSPTRRCHGVDFDTRNDRCYLHMEQYDIRPGSTPGVDNYRRDFSCDVSTTVKPTTRKRGACDDPFLEEPNTHGYDGRLQTGLTTLEACKRSCSSSRTCQALDYSLGQRNCWFYYDLNYDKNPFMARGINHYVRSPKCGGLQPKPTLKSTTGLTTQVPNSCQDRFVFTPDHNSVGGAPQQGTFSADQCAARCRQTSPLTGPDFCWGYDHVTTSSQCWLHLSRFALTTRRVSGVNNYRRIFTCVPLPACEDNFQRTPNFHAPNGVLQHGNLLTEEACAAECLKTKRGASVVCFGFDFVIPTRTCWLHYKDFSPVPSPTINMVNSKRLFNCIQ